MSKEVDWDNPEVETQWIQKQRNQVLAYLETQKVDHSGVAEGPEWFLAPHVSIWRIMSKKYEGATGWWAISGNLPTDYILSSGIYDAKQAMKQFSVVWKKTSEYMLRGEQPPDMTIGKPEDWPILGELLTRRADILGEWAEDDEMWPSV